MYFPSKCIKIVDLKYLLSESDKAIQPRSFAKSI